MLKSYIWVLMKILRKENVTLADLLPESIWDEICAAGRLTCYGDSQLIEERGDARDGLSLVVSGQVGAGNIRRDGSFLISALLREGECFGEFSFFLSLGQMHSLWSIGDSEIVFVGRRALISLLRERPEIYEALLKLALHRNVEILEFLDAQRRLSLPSRIARLLLASPSKGLHKREVECRQEDLAETIGVSRVAIGKALKKLASRGLIDIGYGKIIIEDRAKMAQLVEAELSVE